jgi:chromosome partitioning protein
MKKVIAITHQKGGVGKTTIATNLAVELSKKYKVKVIDLDLQKSMTYFNNIRQKNGLSALDIIKIDNSKELAEAIDKNLDLLIIDVGGYDADTTRVALYYSDVVITPVSDSSIELVGLLYFQKILQELRQHKENLVANILLNRIHIKTKLNLKKLHEFIEKKPEFKKMDSVLRDRRDYRIAFENGKSVAEMKKPATLEINELIQEVIKI